MPARLRVGVLLDGLSVPAWQLVTLRRVADAAFTELVLLVLPAEEGTAADCDIAGTPRSAESSDSVLARVVRHTIGRLEGKFECDHDAFAQKDATSLLRDVPRVSLSGGGGDPAPAALAPFSVDVFLGFGAPHLAARLASGAKHGVWSLMHPYSAPDDPAAAAFWPLYHGWPVGEATLEELAPDGSRRALASCFPATNPFSLRLNRSNLYWRAASLLLPRLRELQQSTTRGMSSVPESRSSAKPVARVQFGAPTTAQLAIHAGRNVSRRARASVARRLMNDQWILLFHLGEELSTSPETFTKIVPPKDRLWADPHVIRRNGRYYVFVEECEFASGKGRIAVLKIEDDGTWGAAETVLERDYHLSYPFVFEHGGELYMVPESEASRTVDLYRCVDFPRRWELVTTLLRDIRATDSTLLEYAGRWWLFANVIETAGESFSEELYVFHSESLVGGDWKPHRRNPIISDSRRSRPAGAVIRRNGRLYRPAQDCSVRYGYGIRVHEIGHLSDSEYAEKEVFSVLPTWDPRIIAVHTLSYTAGLTVFDALQPRLRF